MEWIFGGIIGVFIGHALAEWSHRQPSTRDEELGQLAARMADAIEREQAERGRMKRAVRNN